MWKGSGGDDDEEDDDEEGGGGGGGAAAQQQLPTADRDADVDEDEIPESDTIEEAAEAADSTNLADQIDEGDTVAISDAEFEEIPGTVEAEVTYVQDLESGGGYVELVDDNGRPLEADFSDIEEVIKDDTPPAEDVAVLSTDEKLERAFELAEDRNHSRDMGIEEGNTTAYEMDVLDLPDDSRVYATSFDAYEGGTSAVASQAEARTNNIDAPKVIDRLDGSTCSTAIVEDENGNEYVAKEGIPGPILREYDGDFEGEVYESAVKTFAAGYFVGNEDLHGANVVVNEDTDEVTIIDHDNAGPGRERGTWMAPGSVHDLSRRYFPDGMTDDIRERIYDIAIEYETGDLELPDDVSNRFKTNFTTAVEGAIESAQRMGYTGLPPELAKDQSTPDSYDSITDFEPGQQVRINTQIANEVEGEIERIDSGDRLLVRDEFGDEYVVDDLNDVNEVLDD